MPDCSIALTTWFILIDPFVTLLYRQNITDDFIQTTNPFFCSDRYSHVAILILFKNAEDFKFSNILKENYDDSII